MDEPKLLFRTDIELINHTTTKSGISVSITIALHRTDNLVAAGMKAESKTNRPGKKQA